MAAYITEQRLALEAAIAGAGGGELVPAADLDTIRALPALIVHPAPLWIDGQVTTGPGRPAHLAYVVTVVVKGTDPDVALPALEQLVEAIGDGLPPTWRFDRAEAPFPVAMGELFGLGADLTLSLVYSLE